MIRPGARRLTALLLAVLPGLAACAHVPAAADRPATLLVERDASWSGTVRVDGIVHVRKGATLTILPGTRVVFADRGFPSADAHEGFAGTGIRVEGRIAAEGTPDAPILFTSAAPASRPGAWDKILLTFSDGNRFSFCTFEGARYAIHAHFSGIAIRRCTFRNNEEGVRLGTSRVVIEDSVFTANEIRGINFRECRNTILRNLVTGNGDGIFLHSKSGASVLRENAVYGNRGFNLRLGDLHADDVEVPGNWWGTSDPAAAREKVYDGRNLPGIGRAVIDPILRRPPVGGAAIRGVVSRRMRPAGGATVRAYASAADGFFGDGYAAEGATDGNGVFRLDVPPGRYFVVARAPSPEGTLFAFPGRNPVSASLEETVDVGLPAVLLPPPPPPAEAADRPAVAVTATLEGVPQAGITVQAFRATSPDLRGPGEASAVTGPSGAALLHLPPGSYLLSARKRTGGAPVGVVEEGGLFGIDPYAPVVVVAGRSGRVEIPLFEKRALLAGEASPPAPAQAGAQRGTATLNGAAASGYVLHFYPAGETVGRPLARSSVIDPSGRFTVALPGAGEYEAFLRRAAPGNPAAAGEARIGPARVRAAGGTFSPSPVAFTGPAPRE